MTVSQQLALCGMMLGAPAWLGHRRRLYRPAAHPLRGHEIAGLEPFFDADTLRDVRIARVEQFRPWPFEESLRRVGFGGLLWSNAVAGIALVDTVVIVLPAAHQHRIPPLSLLFHELVHIEQYRHLGMRGFLRHYLGGWLATGRSYEDIPLEVQAYELTDRYDADPAQPFSVTAEVRAMFPKP